MSRGSLSDIHLEIIEEMITESLDKAAKSMEQMLRIRVNPEIIQFGEGVLKPLHEFDDLGRFKVNLMKVAFKGEINGAFYFVAIRPRIKCGISSHICFYQKFQILC